MTELETSRKALAKAAARHPELDLQSAATKIALHLIWEHRQLRLRKLWQLVKFDTHLLKLCELGR